MSRNYLSHLSPTVILSFLMVTGLTYSCSALDDAPSAMLYGNFSADSTSSERWELSKDTAATARLTRDTGVSHSPPDSLRLDTGTGAAKKAVASCVLEKIPAPGTAFRLRGNTKATVGDWKRFGLVLQVFNADWSKQLAWIEVNAPHETTWKGFDQSVTLPEGAAHAVMYFWIEGNGSGWLDDFSLKTTLPAQPAGEPTALSATVPVVVKSDRPAYRWGNVIMGGVEYATGLVWSPKHPEALFLRADGGGIWRLDRKKRAWIPLMDQQTWKDRNLNTVDSIAIDPVDSRTLYVAAGGSRWGKPHDVLKSVDSGVTWQRTGLKNERGEDVISEGNGGDKQGGERLLVGPRNPQTVWFASRNDGLFVSRDAAKTWQSVKTFPTKGGRWHGLTFVASDAARGVLYVGVHAGAATSARKEGEN
ncbi:MAG: hypothetical protein H8F28_08740, partial [Fibrella sp.]|nr:hypothetical protein [Armatimonadota bacterium]